MCRAVQAVLANALPVLETASNEHAQRGVLAHAVIGHSLSHTAALGIIGVLLAAWVVKKYVMLNDMSLL